MYLHGIPSRLTAFARSKMLLYDCQSRVESRDELCLVNQGSIVVIPEIAIFRPRYSLLHRRHICVEECRVQQVSLEEMTAFHITPNEVV